MKKIIELNIVDEFVEGGGVSIGAAGSHDEVLLRCRFSDLWKGTTKEITWINAIGEKFPEFITPFMEEMDSNGSVYIIPVPYEEKSESGKAGITFKGVKLNDDGTEDYSVVTKTIYFVVQEAETGGDGEMNDVLPSVAEQLQEQIDRFNKNIDTSVDNALTKAKDSGVFDGADGSKILKIADKMRKNNCKN